VRLLNIVSALVAAPWEFVICMLLAAAVWKLDELFIVYVRAIVWVVNCDRTPIVWVINLGYMLVYFR
jgi:hypothetical protein